MLHRLLHMISTADLIKNNPDDWRDKLNERSKSKGKVVLVLFANTCSLPVCKNYHLNR